MFPQPLETAASHGPPTTLTVLRRRAGLTAVALVAALLSLPFWLALRPDPDAASAQSLGEYVHAGSWPLPVAPSAPVDLALSEAGWLYAADAAHRSVMAFDQMGRPRAEWSFDPDSELLVPAALAVDDERDKLHVLWVAYALGSADVAQDADFRGVRLETRDAQGVTLRAPRALSYLGRPDDMALDPTSGDLFITSEGFIHRVDAESTWQTAKIDVGDTQGAGGQIAVLDDSHLAIVRPAGPSVQLMTFEGIPVSSLDLAGELPLSVAGDGLGRLQVLIQPGDPDDPNSAIVLSYDLGGTLLGRRSAAALGAPPMGNLTWPWSIAAAPGGLALTSGEQRFFTQWFDGEGRARGRLAGGPLTAEPQPPTRPEDPRPAFALSSRPDGSFVALDGRDARLLDYDFDGSVRVLGGVPTDTLDIALGLDGEIYATTRSGRVLRQSAGGSIAWERDCDCQYGGRISASSSAVYVSRPRTHSAATFSQDDGLSLRSYDFAGGIGLWPNDLAIGRDGALYTGDLAGAMVQIWRRAEEPDLIWQAGLLAGPRRLAVGAVGGQEVVAAVMADGFIEIHEARRGKLLARWRPLLTDELSFDVADIAIGLQGEIYLADARSRAIQIFAPGASLPPTPAPEPSASPTPSDLSCQVDGDKWAAPSTVVLGHQASVTLTMKAECPDSARVTGADIVLIMDRSGSMEGQKLQAAQGAAQAFAELLDVRYHRLGLVSFSAEATVDAALTTQVGDVIEALEALSPEDETNLGQALVVSRDHFAAEGRPEALPVIILLTDGQDNGSLDPRQEAADTRALGVTIYTVGLGNDVAEDLLEDIAGDPARFFRAPSPSELYPIYNQILREVLTSLAGSLQIDDYLGETVSYVDGSAKPRALVSDGLLQWARSLLPTSGITMTYAITATRAGCHPTNLSARARYVDADGVARSYDFPEPTICVITPTPTPTVSPTPTASPTPEPQPIYLPILNGCRAASNPSDVVLLIDTSGSMAGDKLDQAKAAAATFVNLLDLERGGDQAAVIGFDEQPRRTSGLTDDADALAAAVESLRAGAGTRIDRALREAVIELLGPRRKPGNQGVIVLLSDGAHNGPAVELERAVREARSLGALVYAIGLGTDVDMAQLRSIAGSERSFFAADGEALRRIYREIAAAIPCR